MSLELQIISAFCLDLLLGDPQKWPHPVRYIGSLAFWGENTSRKTITHEKLAGLATVILVVGGTAGLTCLVLKGSESLGWLHECIAVYLLYTAFAARDLAEHSKKVFLALKMGNLVLAREKVAFIVGRETACLDEEGVGRACIESVAENLVDGITAPLFWAVLAGPVGALAYKAINTMDSLFGYKNERYVNFGWAAARLDDLANWLPARLTAIFLVALSFVLPYDGSGAYRIWRRDRKKHASPNSGQTEAAVAGALGVQLGGANVYFGKIVDKPSIGEAVNKIAALDILRANRLMLATATGCGIFFLTMRQAFLC